MTSTQNTIHFKCTCRTQLVRIETNLARIVGSQGAQALLARSRYLCGERAQPHALLMQNLLHQIRKFLGNQLAHWLLQSASDVPQALSVRMR